MSKFLNKVLELVAEFFMTHADEEVKAETKEVLTTIKGIPFFGSKNANVKVLQRSLNKKGYKLKVDGDFGNKTRNAVVDFQKSKGSTGTGIIGPKTLAWLGLRLGPAPKPVKPIKGKAQYPSKHRFHPRFESRLPEGYTHLHPFDVARSVAGEKEIRGSKHNPFIGHLHKHSENLDTHDSSKIWADEVPHCSSGLNWCADMSGCEKSDNALASSWSDKRRKSYNPRKGDWVEVGDIIHKKTGKQNHVTICNKRFNKRTDKYYEGFGFNQGNSIKTSTYVVKDIKSVQMWKPKAGTVLAPIGILGTKPVPSTGKKGESTR